MLEVLADPLRTARPVLLLPDWSPLFQLVDHVAGPCKGIGPMCRANRHHNTDLTHYQIAHPVECGHLVKWPTLPSVGYDFSNLGLNDAFVGLVFEMGDPRFARRVISNRTEEDDRGAARGSSDKGCRRSHIQGRRQHFDPIVGGRFRLFVGCHTILLANSYVLALCYVFHSTNVRGQERTLVSDFIDDPDPSIPAPAPDPFRTREFTADQAADQAPEPAAPEPPQAPVETGRPHVDHYRQSSPIERAVRPIEPVATGFAAAPRSVEPVDPAPRTHYYPAPQPVQESPKPARWPLALLAFASGLIGALLVGGGLFVAGVFDDPAPTTTAGPVATAPPGTVIVREVIPPADVATVASAVGRKVVPSIVTVEVGSGEATGNFEPFGSGSGVVFREDGLILTNHHVIDGATSDTTSSRVIFQDGRIYAATIMGSDELTDLAVLKIEATDLTPIEFGSTVDLQIGDRAIAIGNPLGLEGGASLTVGVVSAFDREVVVGPQSRLFNMLQTDAPITNGSSGGALVNAEGRLIGITTAIGVSESGAEGIGFATPVEVVNRIVKQIIESGDVAHAFLGVQLRTNFIIQDDGAAVPNGAVIVGFADGVSSAEQAGLEVNDIIISWNGNDVGAQNDLINGIRAAAVGETITLVVERGGKILTYEIELGERPEGV